MVLSYAQAMSRKAPTKENVPHRSASTSQKSNSAVKVSPQQAQPNPRPSALHRDTSNPWGAGTARQPKPLASKENPKPEANAASTPVSNPPAKLLKKNDRETSRQVPAINGGKASTQGTRASATDLKEDVMKSNQSHSVKNDEQATISSPWKTAVQSGKQGSARRGAPQAQSRNGPKKAQKEASTTATGTPQPQVKGPRPAKKTKPKPQLKSISIADMMTKPSQCRKMPKQEESPPVIASTSQSLAASTTLSLKSTADFPALGAPSEKPRPMVAKSNWGKLVANNNQHSKNKNDEEKKASAKAPVSQPATKPKARASKAGRMEVKKETGETKQSLVASFFRPKIEQSQREGGDELQLLRLLQDRDVYQKKGRQRLHPRKKKFSALKKKVLQERLDKWHKLHSKDDKPGGSTSTQGCTVCIYNYTHNEELEDDDEYQEILDNLSDMASKMGKVKQIFLPRGLEERTAEAYPAFVQFEASKDAAAAQACWQGLVVAGEKLRTFLLDEMSSSPEAVDTDWKDKLLAMERVLRSPSKEADVVGVAVIEIAGILTKDDYDDEDCMQESLGDIRKMADAFGEVQEIEPSESTCGNLLITYSAGLGQAAIILQNLKNTTVGGKPLTASIVSAPTAASVETNRSAIVLDNILTPDDLDDEECLAETLEDIRELAERHGNVSEVKTDGKAVLVMFDAPRSIAVASAQALNDMALGGALVMARVVSDSAVAEAGECNIYLQNILTADDLDDEECLQESLDDIRSMASKHGTIKGVEVIREDDKTLLLVNYDNAQAAKKAKDHFDGMVVCGTIVSATMALPSAEATPAAEAPSTEVKRKTEAEDEANTKKARTEDPEPLYSGDKLIPERFAEAKRVPKIPNAPGPREYAKIVNDERVRPLLSEMLAELMRLQKRAVEENNTKAKRRLVLGLREVARGIRSHKVKMVVMANNLDEYGAIDEKLQEIIDLAHNEDVPLFFEFTKRGLGKAVGKNIKIAVVGIQNADGAYQPFKKLNALASKL